MHALLKPDFDLPAMLCFLLDYKHTPACGRRGEKIMLWSDGGVSFFRHTSRLVGIRKRRCYFLAFGRSVILSSSMLGNKSPRFGVARPLGATVRRDVPSFPLHRWCDMARRRLFFLTRRFSYPVYRQLSFCGFPVMQAGSQRLVLQSRLQDTVRVQKFLETLNPKPLNP